MRAPAFFSPRKRILLGTAGIGGGAAAAEMASWSGLIDPRLLPRLSTVTVTGVALPLDHEFWTHIGATLAACGIGLLIAVFTAVPAGLLLGSVPAVERAVRPLLEFLRPIPALALTPLAIFLWTENQDAKIALIVYASWWPLLINTMYGLAEVDPLAKQTLRSFGFGPLAVLLRVCLPSTAPFIATGLRIAVSITLIVAVSVEIVAGGMSGIGTFIAQAGSANDVERMLAGTLWTGVLGMAANALCGMAERHLFPWRRARTEPS
ncbi:ABC transporter permease [Nonomuraea maheshkhaliensis]|uniref:ABC transporter permease n=1 Tax=Nonomuraea maheshkhaliensis TaxID=419590 RepID=A0ABN2EQE8_9ACTN